MLKQYCRACGSEILSSGSLPLEFCTNCGAHLAQQTQGYPQVNQTAPFNYGGNRKKGNDKTLFWVLISIPVVLIFTGIIGFGILFYAASQKRYKTVNYPPPRSSPTAPQSSTNLLLSFGKDGLGQGEFKRAESVAVDKDGNIYVGDGTLRIQKFDPAGKFLQLWNVTESTVKPDEKYYTAVNNLVIDSKNRLYAVVGYKELLRYDAATGKFIDKIPLYGEKWMNQPQEATIQDVVMLNDDRLAVFATSFPDGEYVIMVSPEGKPEIKHKNLLKKQNPKMMTLMRGSMLVNVTGDIFLMSGMATEKQYLYHYKPDGTYVDRFTWEGAPDFGIFGNKLFAFNSKGEIFAYNSVKKQISVLSTDGVLLRSFPLKPDAFNRMALDDKDNIYVVSDKKIEKFAPSGS